MLWKTKRGEKGNMDGVIGAAVPFFCVWEKERAGKMVKTGFSVADGRLVLFREPKILTNVKESLQKGIAFPSGIGYHTEVWNRMAFCALFCGGRHYYGAAFLHESRSFLGRESFLLRITILAWVGQEAGR